MDKIQKAKHSVIKSIQKLSQDLGPTKYSKIKSKNIDTLISRMPKSQKSLNQNSKKIQSQNRILNIDPVHGDSLRKTKKISIRNTRNMSIESNYEDMHFDENKTMKRNSSLIEIYSMDEEWDSEKTPYSPAMVLKKFSKYLTVIEESEILSHRNIYYIGAGVNKLEPKFKEINNGYDDDRNDYILVKNDHICYRYEILEIIGRGSYGQVIKAYDHKEKKCVALKIIRNLSCIIQQAKIEIQVLYKLIQQDKCCDYLVKIVDHYVFRNHIIQSFDLLDINLYQYLKTRSFSPLPIHILKLYATQLLEGIKYYQSLNILHCDLKPENVMLNGDRSKVIIIDFGSACFANRRIFTYIQSRYYRAPEVILEIGYDYKIDIWSLGCLLAELCIGRPIFAGKEEIDQLFSMMEILGFPPAYLLENSPKCDVILEGIQSVTNARSTSKVRIPGSKTLKQVVNTNDLLFFDFLSSNSYLECFVWDPNLRLSAEEASKHEWLKPQGLTRNQSLPELRWDKLLVPSALTSKKKSIFESVSSNRSLKKKLISGSNKSITNFN